MLGNGYGKLIWDFGNRGKIGPWVALKGDLKVRKVNLARIVCTLGRRPAIVHNYIAIENVVTFDRRIKAHGVTDRELLVGAVGVDFPPTVFLPSYPIPPILFLPSWVPRTAGGAQRRRSFGGVGPGGGRPLPGGGSGVTPPRKFLKIYINFGAYWCIFALLIIFAHSNLKV